MRALVLSLLAVTLLMAFSSIGKAVIEGLALYYDFEGISGDEVIDKSGTGNDGTIMGKLDQVEGKYGDGLLFDCNAANYVDAGEPSFGGLKDGGTIAAWVKPVGEMAILSAIRKDFDFNIFVLGGAAGGEWFKEGSLYSSAGPTQLEENEWYHLAATWDGDTLEVYLDGELEVTRSVPNFPLAGESGILAIGMTPHFGGQPFRGGIDEVAIYDRPLTADELEKVMEGSLASVEASGKLATAWGNLKK